VIAVTASVAEAAALDETLAQIAATAAELVGAKAAAIYLRRSEADSGLEVVADWGFSPRYADALVSAHPLEVGIGPAGLATESGRPVLVEDIGSDPLCAPWRRVGLGEGVHAMVSVPLRPRESYVIGVLNAFRGEPGPWRDEDVDLLSLLADHAAIAIRTADLLENRRRQVQGLSLMVRSLRAQAYEHSNRLHAIHGLLALGEVEQARQLIASVEAGYHSLYGRVIGRIANPTLAGFLVAEAAVAHESGIELSLDGRSRLAELPPTLDDLDALTVLGNLIHNAVEAVAAMPRTRRRVSVRLLEADESTLFRVRDWGPGLGGGPAGRLFEREFTTKPGHAGIGLSLVEEVVRRCRGRLDVEEPRGGGLAVAATFPNGGRRR
jgi:signal transduction histidine kinase